MRFDVRVIILLHYNYFNTIWQRRLQLNYHTANYTPVFSKRVQGLQRGHLTSFEGKDVEVTLLYKIIIRGMIKKVTGHKAVQCSDFKQVP